MRICSSVGSVTVAVPLLAIAISFLLLLELFQHGIEPLETLRPGALVVLDPVVDGLERRPVQSVETPPPVLAHRHDPHFTQDPQVLGDQGLSDPERGRKLVDGALPAGEEVEDLTPPGLCNRVARVCGGRRSCHGWIIYTYIGICQAGNSLRTYVRGRGDDPPRRPGCVLCVGRAAGRPSPAGPARNRRRGCRAGCELRGEGAWRRD